jgi:hypothetical protein
MTEWILPAVAILLTPVFPVLGYFGIKVVNTEKELAAHIASVTATFSSLGDTLTDLKNEQHNQTQKLDRLIEGTFYETAHAALTQTIVDTIHHTLSTHLSSHADVSHRP